MDASRRRNLSMPIAFSYAPSSRIFLPIAFHRGICVSSVGSVVVSSTSGTAIASSSVLIACALSLLLSSSFSSLLSLLSSAPSALASSPALASSVPSRFLHSLLQRSKPPVLASSRRDCLGFRRLYFNFESVWYNTIKSVILWAVY